MSTNTEDVMSPDASPGEQSSKRSGVRRVNNMPLYLIGGGLGVFLLIMVLVASDRAAKQNAPEQAAAQKKAGDTNNFAKEIAGNQKDGIVQAKAAPPAAPDLNAPNSSVAVARPANLDLPPAPPGGAPMQPPSSQQQMAQQQRSPVDEQAERIRQMKEQLLMEAIRAKSGVSYAPPRSAASSQGMAGTAVPGALGAPPATREETLQRIAAVRQQIDAATRDDPTAAYKARLQQLQVPASSPPVPAQGRAAAASLAGRPSWCKRQRAATTWPSSPALDRATVGAWSRSRKRRARRMSCAPVSCCQLRLYQASTRSCQARSWRRSAKMFMTLRPANTS